MSRLVCVQTPFSEFEGGREGENEPSALCFVVFVVVVVLFSLLFLPAGYRWTCQFLPVKYLPLS